MNCTEADCDFADHPNHRHVTRDTVVLDSGRVAYERKPETIAAFLRNLPEAFVDPLEQLELGREWETRLVARGSPLDCEFFLRLRRGGR